LAWNLGQGAYAPEVIANVAFNDTAPRDAVIVEDVDTGTGMVEIVKFAVVAPAETVTMDGVDATGSLENKPMEAPFGPAGPLRVTVPVEGVPPTTEVGASVRLTSAVGGVIVRTAVAEAVPSLAVIVALVDVVTAVVVAVNDADVAPAATVTLGGTVALVLLEDKVTTDPPVGAGPFRLTVPVEGVPPTTEVGTSVTLASATDGVIVSVAVTDAVPSLAVIVAVVAVVTDVVVAVKVADVAPGATVTLAGTTALVLLDERVTTVPVGPAGPDRVTVPIDEFPPRTEGGAIVTLSSVAGVTVRVAVAD